MRNIKLIIIFLLLIILSLNTIDAQAKCIVSGTKYVTMKPICFYYDDYNEEIFVPSKKVIRDGDKLYKKMKKSKKKYVKVKYSETNKNIIHWNRVYEYINMKYFRYSNNKLNIADSWTNGDYTIDYFKTSTIKKIIKQNKKNKKLVKNIIHYLGINQQTTEEEAVMLINQYMIDMYHYNYEYAENSNTSTYKGYNDTYNKYYMIQTKDGVCIDYANTFQILCQEIGIKCGIVHDEIMNHAFNVCTIDKVNCYFDICWNDCGYIDKFSFMDLNDIKEQNRNISYITWYLK